jgi:hypothetical protein
MIKFWKLRRFIKNTQNQNSQTTTANKISSTFKWLVDMAILFVKTIFVITISVIICNLFIPQFLDFNIFEFKPLESLRYDPRYPSLILR